MSTLSVAAPCARKPTTWKNADTTWSTRLTFAKKKRTFRLHVSVDTEAKADARARDIQNAARKLTGVDEQTALAQLALIAEALPSKLQFQLALADRVAKGWTPQTEMVTVRAFGERCTLGPLLPDGSRGPTLFDEFPDLDPRPSEKTRKAIARTFERYIYPVLGAIPLDAITPAIADAVKQRLPADLKRNTRVNNLSRLPWLLSLAVEPARLLQASPLPAKWTPKRGEPRAHNFLYPDEDLALMQHTGVPFCWRLFFGWLSRQGQRDSEAMNMNIGDVDLVHGVVRLEKTKTRKRARSWELEPGDGVALRNYLERYRPNAKPGDPLFLNGLGKRITHGDRPAELLRAQLRVIGLDKTRPQLFEDTAERSHIHVHNLRSTFVTIYLIHENESWVMRHTGHRSSRMLHTYEADVDMARAMKVPRLTTLDLAIPELAERPTAPPAKSGNSPAFGQRSDNDTSNSAGSLDADAIWLFIAGWLQTFETAKKAGISTRGQTPSPAVSAGIGRVLSEAEVRKRLVRLGEQLNELRSAAAALLPQTTGAHKRRLLAALRSIDGTAHQMGRKSIPNLPAGADRTATTRPSPHDVAVPTRVPPGRPRPAIEPPQQTKITATDVVASD